MVGEDGATGAAATGATEGTGAESSGGSWDDALGVLDSHRRGALAMGGEERIRRQRDRGRLNARERIEALFDGGTFVEIGQLVGAAADPPVPADALVAGFGRIDGRPALAGAEDVTVLGGSIGTGAADKRTRLTQLALQERVPLVMLLEGAGHRVAETGGGRRPNDLQGLVDLRGVVPLVCLVLGASAGHGALTAPLCDFVAMTETASIFAAGPPLVASGTGEVVTKEDLGGPAVAAGVGGVVHNVVADDGAAVALARRYLGYLPSRAGDAAPRTGGPATGPRRLDGILDLIPVDPRKPYPVRPVLELLVDAGSLLDLQPGFGPSVVTALARMGGRSVGVVANDPSVLAGTVDADAAEKAARFLEVVGAFGLPCLFLADNPGVLAGSRAERGGILRHAAAMFAAQHRLRVPKIHVTVRKAFGFGSSIMAMNPFDHQTLSLAFPAVTLGALPAESPAGAVADPGERARLAAEQSRASLLAADRLAYDAVVDPRDLRDVVLAALDLSGSRSASPVDRDGT